MTRDWIVNDMCLWKIKDIPSWMGGSGEAIKYFVENVLLKHPNWRILLKNLSDIYVLMANIGSQKCLKEGEKSWKEIMNKEEYDILKKNNYYIVAYMLVEEKNEKIHYIEYFDTTIRKNKFGSLMRSKYHKMFREIYHLIPREIIESSAEYWAKELEFCYKDCKTGKIRVRINEINEFVKDLNLNSNDLSWQPLYNLNDK